MLSCRLCFLVQTQYAVTVTTNLVNSNTVHLLLVFASYIY